MEELKQVNDMISGIKDTEIRNAVQKHKDNIEKVLQPQLKKAAEERDLVYNQISEYTKLQNYIEMIEKQNLNELKMRVDLGTDFYAHGRVSSTEYIYTNVGYGFHVQMTKEETKAFIEKKNKHLEK